MDQQLCGDVSDWSLAKFDKTPIPNFPVLGQEMIHIFSSGQYYACKVSTRLISRNIKYVSDLKVEPLCQVGG